MKIFEKKMISVISLLMMFALCACGGGSGGGSSSSSGGSNSSSGTTSPPSDDNQPDAFAFSPARGVELDSSVTSNTITISGINIATEISISGGEYSVDGGDYTADTGTVNNGQSVQTRLQSSTEGLTSTDLTLTVGGVSATFEATTLRQLLSTNRLEAESQTLLGNAATVNDSAASGSSVAGNLIEAQSGISFVATQASRDLTFAYASLSEVNISVSLADTVVENLTLANTGSLDSYQTHTVAIDISAEDLVSISVDENNTGMRIDYLEEVPDALQVVETYSGGIVGADGISVSSSGEIFVSGGFNGQVLRVDTDKNTTNFATGMNSANGSDFDSQGNLFLAAYQDNAVYRITPDGTRTLFAGNLNGPAGLWIDDEDNVYVGMYGANFSANAASVLRITPAGEVSTYASNGGLLDVVGVTGDENGDIYAGNLSSGRLYRITDGNVRLLADLSASVNMIDYSRGYIYVADGDRARIYRVSLSGEEEIFSGTATKQIINGHILDADFHTPTAVAFSEDDDEMYVIDNGVVRRVYIGN